MEEKQTINWSEMPDKDKVRIILKDIMGWAFYESWDTFSMQHTMRTPTSYPVAFWNDHINKWSVFYRDEENGVTFDPLHDMNDALQIVTHIGEKQGMYVEFGYSPASERYDPSIAHYYCKIITQWWPDSKHVQAYAKTMQDAVCVVALRQKGYQVTNAFESLPAWRLTLEDGEQWTYRTFKEAHKEYEDRIRHLKETLQWAKKVRKLKIEEIAVPEDYFNGIEMA